MFNLLFLDDFFGSAVLEEILREVESAAGGDAEVYGATAGGAVDPRTRSTKKLIVAPAIRERVASAFTELRPALEEHFRIVLTSFEEPQFLRYGPGDFFVAHQDGNTGLIRDDAMHRRVSLVAFLNDAYSGGSLLLHGRYPHFDQRHVVPARPGALVAFPSETTHEVTPVTDGLRYTIVSWYR